MTKKSELSNAIEEIREAADDIGLAALVFEDDPEEIRRLVRRLRTRCDKIEELVQEA